MAAIIAMVALAPSGLARAQAPSPAPSPAARDTTDYQKIVDEIYGKKIAAAKATATEDDDLALARQLLTAASDDASAARLRSALAQAALAIVLPIGTDDSMKLALQAGLIVDKLDPMTALKKAALTRDAVTAQLARARGDRKDPAQIATIAETCFNCNLSVMQAALPDEAAAQEFNNSMRAARGLAQAYRIKDAQVTLDDLEKQFKNELVKRTRVKDALAKLDEAKKGGDAAAIKAASKNLGQVYLEAAGDVKLAARHLSGSDDPRASALAVTAIFLENPKALDMNNAPAAFASLISIAEKLIDQPRINVAEAGYKMAQAYLAAGPPPDQAAKVKLQMLQLESLAGQTPADRLRREILAKYGGFSGKLEVLDGAAGLVRVTYDFNLPTQMKDWTAEYATWDITKGMLACQTNPNDHSDQGRVRNNMVFRFDRPFKITVVGGGKDEIRLDLAINPWHDRGSSHGVIFSLKGDGAHSRSGLFNPTDDAKPSLQRGGNQMEVAYDGKSAFTWTANGAAASKVTANDPAMRELKAAFGIRLFTSDSSKVFTGFDSVTIEGVILPDPKGTPADALPPPKKG